jgi:hypothetical protein
MNGFFTWYTHRVLEEAGSGASGLDAGVAVRAPALHVPDDLAGAATVALIYDETEGLVFLASFVLVREAFEDPGLAADSGHRQAVLGYLKDDSISALPFRRLAEADTARASQLFQYLLEKPGFSWERDGEALLRKYKPWCFGAEPQPPLTPLSSELSMALQSSGVGLSPPRGTRIGTRQGLDQAVPGGRADQAVSIGGLGDGSPPGLCQVPPPDRGPGECLADHRIARDRRVQASRSC